LVRVRSVNEGPSIQGSPDPAIVDDEIPTERVRVEPLQKFKGALPSSTLVFRTGDGTFALEGDPPYAVGETYVMFMSPRGEGDGSYLPSGPDGRLRVRDDSRVDSLIDGPVAESLNGETVERIAAMIKKDGG